MLPHVAEGSLGVLIDNSTVWTEGQLPALSTNANRLPHQALMPVEVCQGELPICAHSELQGYYGCQAGQPCAHKGGLPEDASPGRPGCTRGPIPPQQ